MTSLKNSNPPNRKKFITIQYSITVFPNYGTLMKRSNGYPPKKNIGSFKGLGVAGASGLLAILFPEYFGTVDQFVVKALQGIKNFEDHNSVSFINPDCISIKDGVALIGIMRKKANSLNKMFNTNRWTPRKIDMILWCAGR